MCLSSNSSGEFYADNLEVGAIIFFSSLFLWRGYLFYPRRDERRASKKNCSFLIIFFLKKEDTKRLVSVVMDMSIPLLDKFWSYGREESERDGALTIKLNIVNYFV